MPDRVDPATVIADALGGYLVPERSYPGHLPDELTPWYCYVSDGGHSIVIVTALAPHEGELADPRHVVPAPVKAVLRQGWTITPGGYVRCDLPYDPNLGLITEPGDDQF